MDRTYYTYILASKRHGTLYIGVTNNLSERMISHKHGLNDSFTSRYSVRRLVYFEEFQYVNDAIAREKQLKNWHRQWKINLIESVNPDWEDWEGEVDPELNSG